MQGIPGIYLLLLCDLIKQFGLEEQALLDGMAVTRADLLRGDSRITMKMGHLAAQRATAMAGDRGLGMAYAQALKVTMHGSVGLVAMTSPNIGAALQAMARFIALRAPFFQAEFSADDQGMWVALNPTRDMDPPIRTFITEAILIGVTLMAEQLLGRPLRDAWVEMAGAEPPYYRHYRQRLPAPVRYGGVHCRLRMPVDLCQAVPQLADPAAADLARQQCEQEYQQLFSRQETLAHKIARHLRDSPRGQALPSQEVIARRFHLSSRTLKRRLQELGTCYRELVEEELKQRAMQLLAETRLDISQVADQLGYRDLGTFSTAFNRWTNRTPRDFRRQSLNPSTNQ
ncbi:MAG: AraC family transcriptional regulator [Pseudomonadales bacterium]|nr:AraC family transcriptional regulator [Pseudomonadales bacterium]